MAVDIHIYLMGWVREMVSMAMRICCDCCILHRADGIEAVDGDGYLWGLDSDDWPCLVGYADCMRYDDYVSLMDFLNNRLRKFINPYYVWGIEITWKKLIKWGIFLGWTYPGCYLVR